MYKMPESERQTRLYVEAGYAASMAGAAASLWRYAEAPEEEMKIYVAAKEGLQRIHDQLKSKSHRKQVQTLLDAVDRDIANCNGRVETK